jgi:hypothetical protein
MSQTGHATSSSRGAGVPALPIISGFRNYRRADLGPDFIAGLTTAVMLVPQAMGYALLAGLPPIHGLYASVAPLLLYAVLGTSRQLAVGPVAMDSILVAGSVGAIATIGTENYILLAAALGVMVGVVQAGLGFLRAALPRSSLPRASSVTCSVWSFRAPITFIWSFGKPSEVRRVGPGRRWPSECRRSLRWFSSSGVGRVFPQRCSSS